jgi:hypothetical protein
MCYKCRRTDMQILNEDILLPRGEVLLALGLLFHRASSASTMMECRVRNISMICKSTVWSRHARRHALCQYLTGSVHIIVAIVMWKETRERSRAQAPACRAPAHGKFEKACFFATRVTFYATHMTRPKNSGWVKYSEPGFIISAATSRAFFGAEKLVFPKEHQNPDVNIKCKQPL